LIHRAIYKEADIYLLDDPLSAVDANVGQHLFNQCISGFLEKKAVLLVTHQLQFLATANEILVLNNVSNFISNYISYFIFNLQGHHRSARHFGAVERKAAGLDSVTA